MIYTRIDPNEQLIPETVAEPVPALT
jgi:hypothetical protein